MKCEAEGVALAEQHVANGSKIYADEAAYCAELEASFPDAGRVNHSEACSANGTETNQAESFFARLRRMVSGQHYFGTTRYLHQYATEAAWKEDHRRDPNGMAFAQAIHLAMVSPVSRAWMGY